MVFLVAAIFGLGESEEEYISIWFWAMVSEICICFLYFSVSNAAPFLYVQVKYKLRVL